MVKKHLKWVWCQIKFVMYGGEPIVLLSRSSSKGPGKYVGTHGIVDLY